MSETNTTPSWKSIMANYYHDGSEISRDEFIAANPKCYGCGSIKDLTVHHCLFDDVKKHGKKIKELQDTRNLMTLCRRCHIEQRLYKGYDVRVKFWWVQCKRHGRDKMIEWVRSIDLITREKYELLEEK